MSQAVIVHAPYSILMYQLSLPPGPNLPGKGEAQLTMFLLCTAACNVPTGSICVKSFLKCFYEENITCCKAHPENSDYFSSY